ncbi:hypothetical protein [Spiroplasma sp. DGKH1]|uniref:hypothetical protein n=1 Tax=Spiroplasma sp. DGKH1 TaxID=3050074 RepID=UPI0034C60CFF
MELKKQENYDYQNILKEMNEIEALEEISTTNKNALFYLSKNFIGFRTKQGNLQHNKALTVKIDNFLSDTFDNLKIKNENMMGELVRLNKRYFQITLNPKQEMDRILSKAIKLVENKYHDHLHILFSLLVEYYISLDLAAKIKDILKIIGMTSRVI